MLLFGSGSPVRSVGEVIELIDRSGPPLNVTTTEAFEIVPEGQYTAPRKSTPAPALSISSFASRLQVLDNEGLASSR